MRDRLQGHVDALDKFIAEMAGAQQHAATDIGAWSADLLRLTELIARDFMQEVGEWSVLYLRELPDPG